MVEVRPVPWGANDEQGLFVPWPPPAHSERPGADRPLLADHPGERRQCRGGVQREPGRGADGPSLGRFALPRYAAFSP